MKTEKNVSQIGLDVHKKSGNVTGRAASLILEEQFREMMLETVSHGERL
jgi:hypothetical protein